MAAEAEANKVCVGIVNPPPSTFTFDHCPPRAILSHKPAPTPHTIHAHARRAVKAKGGAKKSGGKKSGGKGGKAGQGKAQKSKGKGSKSKSKSKASTPTKKSKGKSKA